MFIYKGKPFIVYEQGGSCCKRYVLQSDKNVYIKEICKDVVGIENGYKKFYYEIKHIQRANSIFDNLYPKIMFINEDEKNYSVGLKFCYNGITFGDLLRNEVVELSYFRNSFDLILNRLFRELYSKKKNIYNPNYIIDNYINRVRRRLKDIERLDIVNNYGFSSRLLEIEEKGLILNGEYYPPASRYMDYIERDEELLKKLSISYTTESHHDLIPANILVDIGSKNRKEISNFVLIDPRGEIETGKQNRHYMYDMGKMLLGIDTLDIFRIFNGKTSKKAYQYSYHGKIDNVNSFELKFCNTAIIQRYKKAYSMFWNIMDKNNYFMDFIKYPEKHMKLKYLFSQACMYHPDISCRIICEKNEEMAICMYLRGIMMLRKVMDYAYGMDPLRCKENRIELELWPLAYDGS